LPWPIGPARRWRRRSGRRSRRVPQPNSRARSSHCRSRERGNGNVDSTRRAKSQRASRARSDYPWRRRSRASPRASNVLGAFAVDGDVRGARIALVDDVMTTGATLAEATRMLLRAGAADVECWVVARTLRA